ncbi:ABC transporter permease [Schlesneria paludicola]|uniref:ABC transporter permease n=1 Tax=Schlesneria paludicola TaxID=360056 RepID=UPI00029AB92C|nr:ABC transporter permease [Schlesneria paludicola]
MHPGRTFREFGWWHEVVLLILLALLLAVAERLVPGFSNWSNQLYLSRHLWELALLTLGMTLIILTGGIDLSVGSIMGLCAVIFGMTFQWCQRTDVAALACLLTGTLAGALNGFLIARFQLHSLIVTLATFAAYRGIAEGLSQGKSYSQFGSAFSQLARSSVLGIPWPGYLFAVFTILCGVWLSLTPTGRYLYAIGYNERASRYSGISVDRIRRRLYMFSGFLAGLATVIYVSRFNTAKADDGKGFELDVITAVVVGGTSIFGGRGNLLGTVLGLLLIHEIRMFVGRYWGLDELKPIVIGILLIVSILASSTISRQDRT